MEGRIRRRLKRNDGGRTLWGGGTWRYYIPDIFCPAIKDYVISWHWDAAVPVRAASSPVFHFFLFSFFPARRFLFKKLLRLLHFFHCPSLRRAERLCAPSKTPVIVSHRHPAVLRSAKYSISLLAPVSRRHELENVNNVPRRLFSSSCAKR